MSTGMLDFSNTSSLARGVRIDPQRQLMQRRLGGRSQITEDDGFGMLSETKSTPTINRVVDHNFTASKKNNRKTRSRQNELSREKTESHLQPYAGRKARVSVCSRRLTACTAFHVWGGVMHKQPSAEFSHCAPLHSMVRAIRRDPLVLCV